MFVGWTAVVPQEGSICGQMHYASGNDENGIAHRYCHGHLRHMDTHPEKIPFSFMKQVSINCGVTVTLGPQPNMRRCVCVSLHTSACVLAWFLEHHLCVSCYIVLRSTFYTSGLLCSTTTHGNDRVRQIMYPLAPYKRWQWMFSHTDCSSSAICCSRVCKKIKAKQSYIILCW